MKDTMRVLLLGLLLLGVTCTVVWAQATAQVGGTVRDATGAVLPGVDITLTHTDTGAVRSTVTNDGGVYTLPRLAIGPYRLEAALPGFSTFVQTGILEVNSNITVNAVLEVGDIAQSVEVRATAAIVETRTTTVSEVVENVRILQLPLDGRSVEDLMPLTPGSVQIGRQSVRGWEGAPQMAVAGGLSFSVRYTLDGALHQSMYDATPIPYPFPDALQEFRVESTGTSADNKSGNAVSSVTKSGTNEFHGSAFYFARPEKLGAREFFAEERSSLRRHQPGATIGGPILRNRLFFFGGYQGTFIDQEPGNIIETVATPAMLAGDFSEFTSPACQGGRQITLRAPFVNNRVDPSQFSPAAVNIANRLPISNDPCGDLTFGPVISEDQGQFVGRIDYEASARHSVFGRYLGTYTTRPTPDVSENILPALNNAARKNRAHSLTLGSTRTISPRTVQSLRLTAERVTLAIKPAEFFDNSDVGIKAFAHAPGHMRGGVTGGFSLASSPATPSGTWITQFQAAGDLNTQLGAHQVSFGAELGFARTDRFSGPSQSGNWNFDGSATGTGMADFLLGRMSLGRVQAPITLPTYQWYPGAYVQDSWRARPGLTLNAGVRWDPFMPTVMRDGSIYNFSLERFRQGIKSTVFPNAPAGLLYPGDPGFSGRSGMNKQWGNFSPRVGLAWDVQGDGRTSVRASYSFSYEYNPLVFLISPRAAPPHNAQIEVRNVRLDDPWGDFPGGDPFPLSIANPRFPPFTGYGAIPFDNDANNLQSWSLSLQREIAPGWLTSATYVGNLITHLWVSVPLNPAVFIPGASTLRNINERRVLFLENPQEGQFFAQVDEWRSEGTQNYHALMLSTERRVPGGLSFNTNYTWSRCIGETLNQGNIAPNQIGTSLQDANDRGWQRGNCDSDRRHIFNFTPVVEMPEFANPTARKLASGWRLSSIIKWSSGSFLNITSGQDGALNSIAAQRPNQVLENTYRDKSADPMTFWLNRSAFAQPELGTLGNVGRNSVEGPSTWAFDLALSRTFPIQEGQQAEFRLELYNVTNSWRPGNPVTNLRSRNFGQIRTGLSPRIIQLGFKYNF